MRRFILFIFVLAQDNHAQDNHAQAVFFLSSFSLASCIARAAPLRTVGDGNLTILASYNLPSFHRCGLSLLLS